MEGLDPALGDYLLRWREEPSGETGEPGFGAVQYRAYMIQLTVTSLK
jgi:hypothetical protein